MKSISRILLVLAVSAVTSSSVGYAKSPPTTEKTFVIKSTEFLSVNIPFIAPPMIVNVSPVVSDKKEKGFISATETVISVDQRFTGLAGIRTRVGDETAYNLFLFKINSRIVPTYTGPPLSC